MSGYCTVFGIDSHARTTTVCAVDASTGEVRVRTFRGNPYGEMAEWMAGFPQPSYGVYEAGCTGFVPARELSAEGRRVVPIATSHIPTSPDDRSRKTDRRDAERLARLALSGQAVEVWVPDGQTEGLRDLSRAIEDAAERRERCRMQVDAILLRHGYVWDRKTPQGRPVKRWGALHAQWLKGVRLADPASQAAYQAALEAERWASEPYDGLVERAREAASSSALAPAVDAVQWLKGVGFVCALAFCAEVGDFSRFASGRRVTSYFGLAPSERSSGDVRRCGGLTKGGCRTVRRLLVELCLVKHAFRKCAEEIFGFVLETFSGFVTPVPGPAAAAAGRVLLERYRAVDVGRGRADRQEHLDAAGVARRRGGGDLDVAPGQERRRTHLDRPVRPVPQERLGQLPGRHRAPPFPSIRESSSLWLGPPNSTSLPWCTTRSTIAAASLSSANTVPHLLNSTFVVNTTLLLS